MGSSSASQGRRKAGAAILVLLATSPKYSCIGVCPWCTPQALGATMDVSRRASALSRKSLGAVNELAEKGLSETANLARRDT